MSKQTQEALNHDGFGATLLAWWDDLEHDTGGRARLRRARQVIDVVACPAYHRLLWDMQGLGRIDSRRLPLVAMAVSRVRRLTGHQSLGKTMARPREGGGNPRVSGLRFRRLIQIDDRQELWAPMRRVLALVDDTADPVSLARDLYFWGPAVKIRWAEDYYSTAKKAE